MEDGTAMQPGASSHSNSASCRSSTSRHSDSANGGTCGGAASGAASVARGPSGAPTAAGTRAVHFTDAPLPAVERGAAGPVPPPPKSPTSPAEEAEVGRVDMPLLPIAKLACGWHVDGSSYYVMSDDPQNQYGVPRQLGCVIVRGPTPP